MTYNGSQLRKGEGNSGCVLYRMCEVRCIGQDLRQKIQDDESPNETCLSVVRQKKSFSIIYLWG